jgi:hypothetical protein
MKKYEAGDAITMIIAGTIGSFSSFLFLAIASCYGFLELGISMSLIVFAASVICFIFACKIIAYTNKEEKIEQVEKIPTFFEMMDELHNNIDDE